MEALPKISIIIPHYGRRESLRCLIESILRSNYPKDKLEVIIVAGDVKDEEYVHDLLKSFQFILFKMKVLRCRLWYSVSNARNIGGIHAEGDILVFLDDDIVLQRDALEKLVATLINDCKIGCVRPAVFFKDGRLQTLGIKFYKWLGLMRAIDLKDKSLKGLIEVDAGGGVFVVPRKVFLKVLFDECLPIEFEDLDFTLRIKKMGYRIVTVSDAVVIHYKDHRKVKSTSGNAILRRFFNGRNEIVFHYRHGGILSVLIRFYTSFIQSFGRIVHSLLRNRRDGAMLEAYRVLGLLYGIYTVKKCSAHVR